jgi:hypothetical protein
MKLNALFALVAFFGAVLFSYSTVNAQSEEKTKDAVSKTKDVAVEPASKTAAATSKHTVVVTDAVADAAKNAAAATESKPKTTSKSFGGNTVTITDNVVGQSFEDGKWLTVTSWDGTKWVSKRQWFPNKKP